MCSIIDLYVHPFVRLISEKWHNSRTYRKALIRFCTRTDTDIWASALQKSKGWIALKWQILWETNKFQVSFCSPFKFVRRFLVEKKKTSYSEQQRRWSACADAQADLRLCCSQYIKAGFLSDSRHRSSTSCTTFVWTALQWRTNIHTLKH